MSTLPHNTSDRVDSASLVTAQRAGQDIDAIVREFEAATDEVGMARPPAAELREHCRQVTEISRDVFGGEIFLKVGRDGEVSDWVYFLVDVGGPENADEFAACAREWDSAMHRKVGGSTRLFCLSF